MVAQPLHRWQTLDVHGSSTLSGSSVESAVARPFVEPAGKNAAGAAGLAKVRRSAPPKLCARGARVARVPGARGRGGTAADQSISAPAAGRTLFVEGAFGRVD